jgi:transposase-like protein DUF772
MDHPLRSIRRMTDAALSRLSSRFDRLYASTGRPSIPPEQLLRALLLQSLYSIRSERMLIEQLESTCCSAGLSVAPTMIKKGIARESWAFNNFWRTSWPRASRFAGVGLHVTTGFAANDLNAASRSGW